MYGIDIFESIMMKVDWYMIYWGIKNNILCLNIVQDYVYRKMEQDEIISVEEIELSWDFENKIDVLENIEKIPLFLEHFEEKIEQAKEKIRIAIIIFLRRKEKNIAKLLKQVDMIYAEFDYPVDMETFISYMPTDGTYIPKEHTLEENRFHLLQQLDTYISKQIDKYQLQII